MSSHGRRFYEFGPFRLDTAQHLLTRDGDKIGGNAVETGVQVAGIADESDVLVSQTVKDLVAGSGLKFEDRGLHSFGDALGEWQLFAVK